MNRLRLTVICLALAAAGAFPPAAAAGTVDIHAPFGGPTEFAHFDALYIDEVNHVTVTQTDAGLVFEDTAAPLTAGSGCTPESPNRALCRVPVTGGPDNSGVLIETGTLDDEVTLALRPGLRADVYAGTGDDILTGGPSDEQMNAGEGNDTVNPGPGRDVVNGNAGDDVIDTRDAPANAAPTDPAYADVVFCEDGNDRWELDQVDWAQRRDGNSSCETVNRPEPAAPAPGTTTPTPTPPATPTPVPGTVTLKSRTLTVSRDRATLLARCQGATNCSGSLRLSDGKAVVGSGRISLKPGTTGKIAVKLTRQGKAKLARKRSLKIAAASVGAGGEARQLGSVRLTLRRR